MKKGELGNMTLIISFLFILGIIGFGIVSGNYAFFKDGHDIRQAEANSLNEKITECFSENEEILHENDLFSKCGIDEEIIEKNFLIVIKKDNAEIINVGKHDETRCILGDKNKQFPKCKNSTISKDGSQYFILTGSNQNFVEEIPE